MKMCASAVVIATIAGVAGAAPQVWFERSGGNNNGGGAFRAFTSQNGTFETFCIEIGENISMGQNANNGGTYYYSISDRAVNGGQGSDDGPDFDIISDSTKNVYYAFRTGTLQDLVGGNANNWSNSQLRNAVQDAIWYLESEDGSLTGRGQRIIDWASAESGLLAGANRVRVMNVWANDDFTGNRQDQLVIIPLPSVAGLSVAGLLGLAAVRRR